MMQRQRSLSPSPTDEAFKAVWAADYHRALALLHNVDLPGCVSMRARIWLRLDLFQRVIDEYCRRDISEYDLHDGVQLAGFAAVAFARSNRNEEAEQCLAALMRRAANAKDPLLIGFGFYTEARMRVRKANAESIRQILKKAHSALDSAEAGPPPTLYAVELLTARAHVLEVEAWYFSSQVASSAMEKALLGAAFSASAAHNVDRFLYAAILSNLATLVYQHTAEASQHYLAASLESFRSSVQAANFDTNVERALLANSRIFGSYLNPQAKAYTLSLSGRLGKVGDALLYGSWVIRKEFVSELRYAVSIALDIESSSSGSSELFDFVLLAASLAPFDANLSAKFVALSKSVASEWSANSYLTHELAGRAMYHFAAGCVEKAAGQLESSLREMTEALSLLRNEQNLPLEAIIGLERFSISRSVDDLRAAKRLASCFKSQFSSRLNEALKRTETCSPMDFPYLGIYGLDASAPQ